MDSLLSQSLTIGVYLASLGLGSFLATRISSQKSKIFLVFVESLLALLITSSLFFILFLHLNFMQMPPISFMAKNSLLILTSQSIVFFLGLFVGFEIPMLMQLISNEKHAFGYVLGMSYVGGLLGNLLLYFWIVPHFGIIGASILLAYISASVAAVIYIYFFWKKPHLIFLMVMLSLLVPTVLSRLAPFLQQFYLKSYYYSPPTRWTPRELLSTIQYHKSFPDIRRISSPYQEIDIVQNVLHGQQIHGEFYLFIDQKLQNGPHNVHIYHDLMVHGAMGIAKTRPKNVLILGGGDGLLVKELIKYDSIEKIILVELDPEIIHLAKTDPDFLRLNKSALSDPRVHVITGDGFEWVRNSRDTFDAVLVDLPLPHSNEISRLYSTEFYRFIESRLSPNGFLIFDYPFYPILNQFIDDEDSMQHAASVLRSVLAAGFRQYKVYGMMESFLIATKSDQKMEFDYPFLKSKIADTSYSQMSFIDTSPFDKYTKFQNSIFHPQLLPHPSNIIKKNK